MDKHKKRQVHASNGPRSSDSDQPPNQVRSSLTKDIADNQHLAQAIKNIKHKYNALKSSQLHQEDRLEKTFNPIIKPLKSILANVTSKRTSSNTLASAPVAALKEEESMTYQIVLKIQIFYCLPTM